MQVLGSIFTLQHVVNVLDVLVVWYVIYVLMMLLRGTKAVQLFKGVVVIIVVKLISWYVGLETLSWIMDQVINWGIIAIIVIFQPEIRRETGIKLDANITGALLINIFIPNTPLHDGAVIIKDNKIAVAAAYLPLSESNLIPKELGTRHRAAVGISEVTDALTIVVSEETGGVTITKNNELIRDLARQDYLKLLRNELVPKEEDKKQSFFERVAQAFLKGGHKH